MSVRNCEIFYMNKKTTLWIPCINAWLFLKYPSHDYFIIIKKLVNHLSLKVLNSATYSNLKLYRLKINPIKYTKAHYSHVKSLYLAQNVIKIVNFLK